MSEAELPREWPHDLPDAEELLKTVRAYLADDLGPRAEGRDRWLLRIATNALTIAARELSSSAADRTAHAARLAALGVQSESELATAIRDGVFDNRRNELAEALWATTLDKLAVASPSYREDSSL